MNKTSTLGGRIALLALLILVVSPAVSSAAIYSYLSNQYPGLHQWRLANITGPVRTQDGWLYAIDRSEKISRGG